jgi:hypothetical protein
MPVASWFALTRACVAALTAVASGYFVLAAFTAKYFGIGPLDLTSGVRTAVGLFPVMYWVVYLAVATTLIAPIRARHRLTLEWLVIAGATGVAVSWLGLTAAPADDRSLTWSLVATFPAALLGVVDIALAWPQLAAPRPSPRGVPFAQILTAVALVATVFAMRATTMAISAAPDLVEAIAFAASCGVASVVAAVAVALAGISAAQALIARARPGSAFVVACVGWWGVAAVVTRRVIAQPLALNDTFGDFWSAVIPLPFVLLLAGTHLAVRAIDGHHPAVDALGPLGVSCSRRTAAALGVAAVCAALVAVPVVAPLDWQGLFQHLLALSALLSGVVLAGSTVKSRGIEPRTLALVALCALPVAEATARVPAMSSSMLGARGQQAASLFAGLDPLTRTIQQLAQSPFRDAASEEFYRLLSDNNMITASVQAPRIELGPLTGRPAFRPDIYLIVVDSLRQDFVAPYGRRAQTPAIEALAREGTVFRDAYTRFVGTTLSQAAIFTGSTLVQHEYPRPFADINALEQLTTADGYVRILARDATSNKFLSRFPTDRPIETGLRYWAELRADSALRQITSELTRVPDGQPVFAFVQPQDIHSIALSMRADADAAFRRLPVAERYRTGVEDVDRAVGEFVASLKRSGRFDRSIIILTSDHGEGIGDFGRWGHGDSVLPDALRVPLIVRLPAAYRHLAADTQSMAMTTDIVPSLYYLLGHRPTLRHTVAGRPLFTESEAEQQGSRREYEVVSNSYRPTFGVLDRDAHTLYFVDAITRRQGLFDLRRDPHALRNIINVDEQQRGERRIRAFLGEVNRLYGFTPPKKR